MVPEKSYKLPMLLNSSSKKRDGLPLRLLSLLNKFLRFITNLMIKPPVRRCLLNRSMSQSLEESVWQLTNVTPYILTNLQLPLTPTKKMKKQI